MMLTKTFLFSNRFIKAGIQSISLSTVPKEKVQKKFLLSKRFKSKKSVWNEYARLAREFKPINLGAGFPDFGPPSHLSEALAEVAGSDDGLLHQYARGSGHVRLVTVLSKFYSRLLSRDVSDPLNEILVTYGATEALYCSINAFIDECDEVIMIEPCFDCYAPMVKCTGGTPRRIALKQKSECNATVNSEDFVLDPDELEKIFNKNTKIIIVNTPNNPLGKVYSACELQQIADLCIKWNVLCIADEVYEWLVYEPSKHVRIATLPGMWERTITISSAAKTFCATGWKLGWAVGPSHLIPNLQLVHQTCVESCASPIQEAFARTIEKELCEMDDSDSYLNSFACEAKTKRDFMYKFLGDAGMKPIMPQGGYFVVADWTPLESRVDLNSEKDEYKDYRFTKWMSKNVGVQGIPISAFYSKQNKNLGVNFARYCFIKKDENLKKAADILKKWKSGLK